MNRFLKHARIPAAWLALCLLLEPALLAAQVPEETMSGGEQGVSADAPGEGEGEEILFDAGADLLPGEGLEGAVSGLEYRIGPGDVLVISIWGPEPKAYRLPVTLEGKLLVPDVGEIPLDGLFLTEAKERIRREMLRKFRNVEIAVTLVGLRKFKVHVLGRVDRPGTYLSSAVDRLSVVISQAGGLRGNASARQIRIENSDSLRTTGDLMAFFRTGDVGKNPLLRDGDLIHVKYAEDHVTIRGEVNREGPVEFVSGDRFSTLLELVSGFTAEAYLDTIEVARYTESRTDPVRFLVVSNARIVPMDPREADRMPEILGTYEPPPANLSLGRTPVYPDFELAPEDFVFVRRDPDVRGRGLVEIRGEVLYPGFYPLDLGETRLADAVAMAGGLTSDASLLGAELIRRVAIGDEDPEFERLKRMPRSEMDELEYEYFKIKSREVRGRMVVDFRRAVVEKDPVENILLDRGDLIRIPARKNYVKVLGTVANPGNVSYQEGLEAGDYIELAGGYTEEADLGNSRVLLVEGGWLPLGEAGELEPGDSILIPEKRPTDFWNIFRTSLTITLQILTIYLIADRALE